jgi:hypothetical protein
MSRKQCRRKIWSTNINPVAHAIAGAAIVDQESLDKLRMGELLALDAMRRGQGTLQDWVTLNDMLNISFTFIRHDIGVEARHDCEVAMTSLKSAALRYEKTKRMGLDGLGIKALQNVFEWHDLQRTSVARSVYEKMIEKTSNYIRSKGKDVIEI